MRAVLLQLVLLKANALVVGSSEIQHFNVPQRQNDAPWLELSRRSAII